MKLFTIGFTKSTAEHFFGRLRDAGVRRLVDVRLNNVSQLAGFAKRDDLRYFLKALCNADYVHMEPLAPTQELLDSYKKRGGKWEQYEHSFLELMRARKVETLLTPQQLENACLLCSEDKPHHCHRRIVAEYLREKWGGISIVHL